MDPSLKGSPSQEIPSKEWPSPTPNATVLQPVPEAPTLNARETEPMIEAN